MVMPFYVSPEQMTADKAEFARKGIARGKSLVTLEYEGGILLVGENPFDLSKIGEIYDRIAFAGVGKYSEFDRLRKIGVQWADVEGYRFSREDVRAKALANLYSQLIGDEFIRSLKPLEVEIVVAEVGDDQFPGHERNAIYKVQYDGVIADLEGFCVVGGNVENVQRHMQGHFHAGLELGDALRLGREALQRAENGRPDLPPENLEVCLLDRRRTGRKFRRLDTEEIRSHLQLG
jgi:proteasome alpha subunit